MRFYSFLIFATICCGIALGDWEGNDSEDEELKRVAGPFDDIANAQNDLSEKFEKSLSKLMFDLEPVFMEESESIEKIINTLDKTKPASQKISKILENEVGDFMDKLDSGVLEELKGFENPSDFENRDLPKFGQAADEFVEKFESAIMPNLQEKIADLLNTTEEITPEVAQDLEELTQRLGSAIKPILRKNIDDVKKSLKPANKNLEKFDTAFERKILPKIESEARDFWSRFKEFYVENIKDDLSKMNVEDSAENTELALDTIGNDVIDLAKEASKAAKSGDLKNNLSELFEMIW